MRTLWACALLCVALRPAADGARAPASLVANGDFLRADAARAGLPAEWTVEPGDAAGLYRLVDDDGHSGNASLRYRCEGVRPGAAVVQSIACKPNTRYALEAWLKSDGALRPMVVVSTEGEAPRDVARVTGEPEQAWQAASATFNSGAAEKLRIRIYGDVTIPRTGQSREGSAWVDDVRIAEAPEGASAPPAEAAKWTAPGPNLALNKPYTFSRKPTYGLCADAGDTTQLTDGTYTVGYFWTQKSTVGWSGAGKAPLAFTVDLGQVEPIGGVSLNTAAGAAQVNWPAALLVFTSDDGKTWHILGDLVRLSVTGKVPDGYGTHRYATDRVKTRGRYVMFVAESDNYFFCDEVEVYRAAGDLPQQAQGGTVADPLDYLWRGTRMEADLETIAGRLQRAGKLTAAERQGAERELAALRGLTGIAFPAPPTDEPALLPVNAVHARVFALNGVALRGQGMAPLTAWKKNRYDPLDPIELPATLPKTPPTLSLSAMNGEWRGDAVVLTNATEKDVIATIRLAGFPDASCLSIRDVPFVESSPRVDVACPLPAAGATLRIPAGMNRQVWVVARPRKERPGEITGTLQVNIAVPKASLAIPVRLRISPVPFPERPRCHLGGWDYTDSASTYDAVPSNRELLVAYLRERYCDTPWAGGGALPGVKASDFDAAGKLTGKLDFARLDDWVRRWTEPIPGHPDAKPARLFMTFVNGGKEFAGAKLGEPQFAARIAAWITAIAVHLKEIGLRPEQLGLLIYDEPNNEVPTPLIRGWADAIHAAGTGIRVFEDPQYREPGKPGIREALEACDILSPFVPTYFQLDAEKRGVYRSLTATGVSDASPRERKLWFYNACGPVRALDPYSYHRLQHWLCFREGGEGSEFWAFGDAGGGSSWNERGSKRGSGYAPQYLAKDSVTDSKHMMGIIEGIQDHERLSMLRDRVAAGGGDPKALAEAKALLDAAPAEVLAGLDADVDTEMLWKTPKDRTLADRMIERVLLALEKLAARK